MEHIELTGQNGWDFVRIFYFMDVNVANFTEKYHLVPCAYFFELIGR